jgi:hypothetical protein
VIPREQTEQMTCGSFCGSCSLLIDKFEQRTGEQGQGGPALPFVPADALWSRGGVAGGRRG